MEFSNEIVDEVVKNEIDKSFEELTANPNALITQIYGDINNYREKSYFVKNQITTLQGKIKHYLKII